MRQLKKHAKKALLRNCSRALPFVVVQLSYAQSAALPQVIASNNPADSNPEEADTLDAFVAMGGQPDKSGEVSADKLRATIRAFELTLDIEKLIDEVDKDGSGFLDYQEFRAIMS